MKVWLIIDTARDVVRAVVESVPGVSAPQAIRAWCHREGFGDGAAQRFHAVEFTALPWHSVVQSYLPCSIKVGG